MNRSFAIAARWAAAISQATGAPSIQARSQYRAGNLLARPSKYKASALSSQNKAGTGLAES